MSSSGLINSFSPSPRSRGQVEVFQPGFVDGAFSVVFSGSELTWRVGTAHTTPNFATAKAGTSKLCAPVEPIAQCADSLPGGVRKVIFGYSNQNPFSLSAPIGSSNKVSPGATDRGQPTTLLAGTVASAFVVETSEASLSWTLFGKTATADSSTPHCTTNKPPQCKAGLTPYIATCQGIQTTIALTGSSSVDPEGFPLAHRWSTDCEGATFDDATKANPTLLLSALSGGKARSCVVTLKVDDGVSVVGCSQNVSVSTCNIDCAGTVGGSSTTDVCGVCGGNGTSCTDCAGVPNGTSVVDRCGVCGGNDSCLDCKGVVGGSSKLDICGVCDGDNKSCLACAEVDVSQLLFSIDGESHKLRANVTLATRRLASVDSSSAAKIFIARTLAQASEIASSAWSVTWSVPSILTSCVETVACLTVDNSPAIDGYQSKVKSLRTLTATTMRMVKKARKGKLTVADQKISRKADVLVAEAMRLSNQVPRFTNNCDSIK